MCCNVFVRDKTLSYKNMKNIFVNGPCLRLDGGQMKHVKSKFKFGKFYILNLIIYVGT